MQNYFHLLSLPIQFTLDKAALRQAAISQQQFFHPDKQIGKSDIERQKAALQSATINDALTVLEDDYSRAAHLLALKDIYIHGDNATVKPNSSLLMEVMEINESIEQGEVQDLQIELQQQQQKIIEQLTADFNQSNFSAAAQNTLRLRYFEKSLEQIQQKLRLKAS